MALELYDIIAPGSGGLITDKPEWAVDPNAATYLSDAVDYHGLVNQRRGWANYRTAVTAASALSSAARFYLSFTDGSVDVVSGTASTGSTVWSWNGTNWQSIFSPLGGTTPPDYIPRTQYQDEILLCDQNGVWPMLRFMGRIASPAWGYAASIPASSPILTLSGTGSTPVSDMSISSSTSSGVSIATVGVNGPGSFIHAIGDREMASMRVDKRTAGSADFSLRNVLFSSAFSGTTGTAVNMYGTAWPAVSVNYDGSVAPGTVPTGGASSAASTTLTGTGTTFSGGNWGSVYAGTGANVCLSDGVRISYADKWTQYGIRSVDSATQLTLWQAAATNVTGANVAPTKTSYDVMRRLPFKDVEVHKECLWGTGVKQYPSRVYYSPRNWDMQTPPELSTPWNGITDFYEEGAGKLRYVDVTGENAGDPVIALIASDGPLLILTARAVYGVYGSWPDFTRQALAHGAGCIDTRSAVGKGEYGQFWAGENGIYGFRNGKVNDLTAGKISTEWRALMRKFNKAGGSWVAAGLTANHLIVSAYVTQGTPEQRTYALNLSTGAWTYLSNLPVKGFYDPGLWNEGERLLAVLSGSNQVIDIAPALNMSGTPLDANTNGPRLQYTSPSGIQNKADPNDESRLVEIRVGAYTYDKATPSNGTTISVNIESSGKIDGASTDPISTDGGEIVSDNDSRLKRKRIKVGAVGRQHSVSVDVSPTASTNAQVALAELGMNVRKRRRQK